MSPYTVRRSHRRMDGSIKDQAVALVVVGAAAVFCNVEVVDRRAEEKLANIVDRLRPVIRNAIASPWGWLLPERDGEAVVVGVCRGAVLLVVAEGRIRAASIVRSVRNTGWRVSVDRSNQMYPTQMLIADAQRTVHAELLLHLQAGLLGVCILHVAVHGGEVDQHVCGKRGQCVGEGGRSGLRR